MPRKPPRSRPTSWRRLAVELCAIAVVLLAARSSLANHYVVPSGSMLPTVEVGDRIVVAQAAYGLRVPFGDAVLLERDGPARGDVAVLISPEDGTTVLLKRVVGLPGDRVEVRGGRVRIGDVPVPVEADADGALWETLGDRHRIRLTDGGGPDLGPIVLADDEYLVLGDNRGDSKDGRVFGPVSARAFRGRALKIYWRDAPTWRDL
jgi:signal peptidase I